MTVPPADAAWLQAEYRKAWRAAADARGGHRERRNTLDLCHASATARMCALGEAMQTLGVEVPPRADEPVTTD